MKTTGDQQLVKRINRSVLLRLIRAQPGLSRAQAASQVARLSGESRNPSFSQNVSVWAMTQASCERRLAT